MIVILAPQHSCKAAESYCKHHRSSKAVKKRQPVIPMCKIEKRKPLSDRWGCDHVLIKVEICDYFREDMKKDDEDRRCSCSEEFCKMEDWEERIEHGSWYRRVRACSKYSQEDPKKWRGDKDICKKWGHKGGPCGGKEPWNRECVISKYRKGAKEPYNITPSSLKLRLAKIATT
jgi:hypothetical protein